MGKTMTEKDRRRRLFDELDAAYEKLQEDPEARRSLQAELRVWDATLRDGLEREEGWGEDGAPNPELLEFLEQRSQDEKTYTPAQVRERLKLT